MSNLFQNAPNPCRLLIITPDEFAGALIPLLNHKNLTGMPAHIVEFSKILPAGLSVGEHPLAIKRVIAEGHETRGVYYVMLVGDASKFPTRHRFVKQPEPEFQKLDGTYNPTDFYYANLYKKGGQAAGFSDWDANRDGKFNEEIWISGNSQSHNPDQVEGFLDVAVGRVPAHTVEDIKIYVNKVIDYEMGFRQRSIEVLSFLSDGSLDRGGRAADSIIALSNIESLPNSEVKQFLGNTSGDLPTLKWTAYNGESKNEYEIFTSKWVLHIGHGYNKGWAIGASNNGQLDETYVKGSSLIHGDWNVGNSFSLPIVFSAGCDTGQFLPNAGYDGDGSYLGLDGRSHFVTGSRSAGNTTDNGTALTKPVRIPLPSPYDFPEQTGRTVAHAWLCDSSAGGAIAYSGATVVHQGGTYGADLFLRAVRQITKLNVLGDVWAQAARDYLADHLYEGDVLGDARIYLSIQSLFGDPSLRLKPVDSYGLSATVANERLTVFARTNHGTLTNRYYDAASSTWPNWSQIGDGQISSGASAVMANGRLTVFARSQQGTLTHKYYDSAAQRWTGWQDLGGNPISAGVCAIMAGERLVVFSRDQKGCLTNRYYDQQRQGWTDWARLGEGQISSTPSAVMAGSRLTVFARTMHGTLTHKYYDPAVQKWTDWRHLGDGQISSAPSAVMAGERLTVFARTLNGTLSHKYYDRAAGDWSDWKQIGGGQISCAPCAVMAGERLTVFARTMHETLTHKFYNADGWTDWQHLGDEKIS
jgi:Peptidase family C25/Repeat of unknown function (DUF346)